MTTIERQGYTFGVTVEYDACIGAPWIEHDGHGIIRESRSADKRAGETLIHSDRGTYWYYDVAATLKIARRDGWGARGERKPGETDRQYAVRAVASDFEYCAGWIRGDWSWITVGVHSRDFDAGDAYLGGIESSDTAYIMQCAAELADEMIAEHLQESAERAE